MEKLSKVFFAKSIKYLVSTIISAGADGLRHKFRTE